MKYLNHNLITLFVLLIFLYSCDSGNDDIIDADKSAYLELEIDESLLSYNSDFWVVVTNDEGEVLKDSLIMTGGKIEFDQHENELSDNLGVYFFKVYEDSKHYRVEGMLGIKKNSSLTFEKNWDYGKPEVGTVDVEVTNFPNTYLGVNLLSTSNTSGFSHKESEVIDADPYDLVIDTMRFKMSIVRTNDTLLIGNSYKDNDPRYLRVEGVNDGEKYFFDFEKDFVPYERIVTHEAPVSNSFRIQSYVFGYKSLSLFYTSMRNTAWSYRFTQFGYMEGFDNYRTFYSVGGLQGYYEIGFVKMGQPVNSQELDLPEYSLSILDTTFTNFKYSYSRNITFRKANWTSKDRRSSVYVAEDLSAKCKQLLKLPISISSQYDFVQLDQLDFVDGRFIETVNGYSYLDLIGSTFSNFQSDNEYEYNFVDIR